MHEHLGAIGEIFLPSTAQDSGVYIVQKMNDLSGRGLIAPSMRTFRRSRPGANSHLSYSDLNATLGGRGCAYLFTKASSRHSWPVGLRGFVPTSNFLSVSISTEKYMDETGECCPDSATLPADLIQTSIHDTMSGTDSTSASVHESIFEFVHLSEPRSAWDDDSTVFTEDLAKDPDDKDENDVTCKLALQSSYLDFGIEFDWACVEELDDALLRVEPMAAFASLCWQHAVSDHDDLRAVDAAPLRRSSVNALTRVRDHACAEHPAYVVTYDKNATLRTSRESYSQPVKSLPESITNYVVSEEDQERRHLQRSILGTSVLLDPGLFSVPNPNNSISAFPRPNLKPTSRRKAFRPFQLLSNRRA